MELWLYTGFGNRVDTSRWDGDKSFSGVELTATTAKKYLQGLSTGAYIRLYMGGKDYHSVAVLSTSDNGIEVYQANLGGKCLVTIKTYTWSEFANAYPQLLFFVD